MGLEFCLSSKKLAFIALESNIGLNAIAQYTAEFPMKLEHGLGTGQLYHNNIPSPLRVENGTLYYDMDSAWDLSCLHIDQS